LGLGKIIESQIEKHLFQFAVERAVFLTVLHRLFDPGSGRAAEVWCERFAIKGVERLKLHHLYRAMARLSSGVEASARLAPHPVTGSK
jgi:hypothetical protein